MKKLITMLVLFLFGGFFNPMLIAQQFSAIQPKAHFIYCDSNYPSIDIDMGYGRYLSRVSKQIKSADVDTTKPINISVWLNDQNDPGDTQGSISGCMFKPLNPKKNLFVLTDNKDKQFSIKCNAIQYSKSYSCKK